MSLVYRLLILITLYSCIQEKEKSNNKGERNSSPSAKNETVAQIPTNPWIKQLGASTATPGADSSKVDACASISTDIYGNVYCAGSDAFVMKLNSSGELVWTKQLGNSTLNATCYGVSVDNSGNVYCAGVTYGSLGEGQAGGGDAFVMKLNSSGELVWIRQLGNSTITPGGDASKYDDCASVAVDNSGNVYCAGLTYGSLGEEKGAGADAFVMKLNSSGELVWIMQLGNSAITTDGSDSCNSTAVDQVGNVYCAGSTSGSLGEENGGESDVFVMKLSSSGELVWIRQLGASTATPGADSSQGDECRGIAIDITGNVYCTGSTLGSLGEGQAGGGDAFVMKLNSSGELVWIRQLGNSTITPGGDASKYDDCASVAVDNSGNVYCAGETSGALGEANGGGEDAFVMKLNSSGDLQWIKQLGNSTPTPGGDTSKNDECFGVAVDTSGNVYCAGRTYGSLGEVNGGGPDVFVIKLNYLGEIN